jgi:hypothetical protein
MNNILLLIFGLYLKIFRRLTVLNNLLIFKAYFFLHFF